MTYNLLREAWIPWRRLRSGTCWAPLTSLVSGISEDPVVGLAAPRPDFNGALQEFLIGLLTMALMPDDEEAWRELHHRPPMPEALQTALDALPAAFHLNGDGPRFFQDRSTTDFVGVNIAPVEQLLIDTPGEQTMRLNKDLFVKRGRVEQLSRPAAAMALLTLQTYAPAGGQGHRTSLRGGGPLTTLVDPRVDVDGRPMQDAPLWNKLWANVETQDQWRERRVGDSPVDAATAFPWLSPTRTSNPKAGGGETFAARAHPLGAYFGLPRRIRLEFAEEGRCELTGLEDAQMVTGFRMRNYGAQYAGWHHPLTPYYRPKVGEPWLPMHGQPGGVGWRDWLSLTIGSSEDGLSKPATVVTHFTRERVGVRRSAPVRLHVFGYDMDNMKARGWTEAAMPVFVVSEPARQERLRSTAQNLVDATGMASSALLSAVKKARFLEPEEVSGDIGPVRGDLWNATEADFYRVMRALAESSLVKDAAAEEARKLRAEFGSVIRDRALEVFDRWSPAAGLPLQVLRRRVTARHDLSSALGGYSKLGEKIFEVLGISLPGGGRKARTAKNRERTEATT